MQLYEDYKSWCERQPQKEVGSKTFSQTLASLGVVKLERRGGGQHFELELL
jgi:phage/plasmid-associated DNA primase